MDKQLEPKSPHQKTGLFYRFDDLIKGFIPNFNVRAILYMTVIFFVALFLLFWRI